METRYIGLRYFSENSQSRYIDSKRVNYNFRLARKSTVNKNVYQSMNKNVYLLYSLSVTNNKIVQDNH